MADTQHQCGRCVQLQNTAQQIRLQYCTTALAQNLSQKQSQSFEL